MLNTLLSNVIDDIQYLFNKMKNLLILYFDFSSIIHYLQEKAER